MNEFQTHIQLRRSLWQSNFPKKLNIYEVDLPKTLIAKVIENNEITPKNYKEVLQIPHWQNAMNEEYKALVDNNTWKLKENQMVA